MTDQALVTGIAAEVLEVLAPRFDRVERAIMGEGPIGHIGLVGRVQQLETSHTVLAGERLEGDRRLHERIDGLHNGKASAEDFSKLSRKVDRVLWIVAGVGLGSGGLGAWLGSLASGP